MPRGRVTPGRDHSIPELRNHLKQFLLILNFFLAATAAQSQTAVAAWVQRYNGPGNGNDAPAAIAVDTNGSVIVTGYSSGGSSSNDYATIKYSSAGMPLWTNLYNGQGNGDDAAAAIAVDIDGNVIVTGASSNGTNNDYATIKYSSVSVPLWTNRYNGPGNGDDAAVAIAVDGSGNAFVTGYSYGSGSDYDYATIMYSNAGVPLWTNIYNAPFNGPDKATRIAVDTNGNVFVTGSSSGGPSTSYDYATIMYSNSGVPMWTNRYDGPISGSDGARALAVDANGNVFVSGHSWNGTNDDYATIKYSVAQPIHLDIQLVDVQVVLSWTNAGFGLQSAPAITDTFTNIAGATSPYTNAINGGQQYFRLISN